MSAEFALDMSADNQPRRDFLRLSGSGMARADFFHVRAPHVQDAPVFTLSNVDDFIVSRSKGAPDRKIAHTTEERL